MTSPLPLPLCLLLCTLYTTCDCFYRKPYVVGSITKTKLIPPKPATTQRPFVPVIYTEEGNNEIIYYRETPAPEMRRGGGKNDRYAPGWGITFNIWIWVEVVAYTETYVKWHFQTTTIPSVVVVEWYTTEWHGSWGHQIRAYDDQADEIEKKKSGLDWTCFSWHRACVENNYLRNRLIKEAQYQAGKMRSIGGGTDGTDNTLIAFIVIAVLIGGGIGGVIFYQKKNAAILEEEGGDGEGDIDGEAKEEPTEGAGDEKEEEAG